MTDVLEVELDLDVTDEMRERHGRYVASGMSEDRAWRQVAQDEFGSLGGVVQGVMKTAY